MQTKQKPNKPGQQTSSPVLKRVRKSVYKQAMLAGLLIVLTVVVLFAMTAAWYTNIAQTSGLVFETSSWGFDGTVSLVGQTIQAAPGDEGVVELTATSNSEELTAVSLNVARSGWSDEMRQRIFFYIDTAKVKNGETMDRVYLSGQDSYSYLLFSKQTLMLTEEVHNDALLKWHWVYDVLGYYVQGTITQTTTSVTGEDEVVTTKESWSMGISEYLRPIEYDFDEAKTTFVDGNGDLLTIDGTKTVETFLAEVSGSDGYAGTIDISKAVTTSDGRIYYPVSVDENGSGVWAYLCTYSEIITNTTYDTYLGKTAGTADAGTYTAVVTIAAQNTKIQATPVSTAAALESEIAAALESGEKAIIQLADNIELSSPLVIGGTEIDSVTSETVAVNQQVMLDLNGNALTVASGSYASTGAAVQVEPGSSLTLTNGTLVCSDASSYAIEGTGAEVTLSDVTITGVKRAIVVKDNADTNTAGSDAMIRLVGCTFDTTDVSVMISGNGTDTEQDTQLIVENCSIRSDYIGIAFNGSTDQWGTSSQVINSQVYGYWTGIYQPAGEAELVISGKSVISGYTGMVLKGGETVVLDSTIHGTGAEQVPETEPMSGFNDTGDAIYIESNYGWEILLDVDGASIVTSDKARALRVYPYTGDASYQNNVSVLVYSGRFSSDVTEFCAVTAQCTEVLDTDGSTVLYYLVEVPAAEPVTETITETDGGDTTDAGQESGTTADTGDDTTGAGEEQSDSGTT